MLNTVFCARLYGLLHPPIFFFSGGGSAYSIGLGSKEYPATPWPQPAIDWLAASTFEHIFETKVWEVFDESDIGRVQIDLLDAFQTARCRGNR